MQLVAQAWVDSDSVRYEPRPSQLHRMTYAGADGTNGLSRFIYQGCQPHVVPTDQARCQKSHNTPID